MARGGKLQVGDTCYLKCGGPPMVVGDVRTIPAPEPAEGERKAPDTVIAVCIWFSHVPVMIGRDLGPAVGPAGMPLTAEFDGRLLTETEPTPAEPAA